MSKPLSAAQRSVLERCVVPCAPQDDGKNGMSGICRSLVMRGLLRRHRFGYQITAEGRAELFGNQQQRRG